MPDAVLVNCRTQGLVSKVEHLGLGYLAASLETAGYSARVVDASFHRRPRSHVVEGVSADPPFLLGFTVYYNNVVETLDTIAALRRLGFDGHVTLGGHHATFHADALLRSHDGIDSIVLGEGEGAVVDLCRRLDSGSVLSDVPNLAWRRVDGSVRQNRCRELIGDLDALAPPHRGPYAAFLREHGMASVITSRGCYGRCSFCSIRAFYGLSRGRRWRPRRADAVVDELELLVSEYGVRRINFLDDEFLGCGPRSRARALAIGEEIRRRRLGISFNIVCRPDSVDREVLASLREAGLFHVSIGVESFVPRQLELLGKGSTLAKNRAAIRTVRELDLDYMYFLIPADPFVTIEELMENLDGIEEAGIHHANEGFTFSRLMVFRGTLLEARLGQEGLLKEEEGGSSWAGPSAYEFADPRVRRVYRRWEGLYREYVRLRTRLSTLELNRFGGGTEDVLNRACRRALSESAHRMFRRLVVAVRDDGRVDFEAELQDELDGLALAAWGQVEDETFARAIGDAPARLGAAFARLSSLTARGAVSGPARGFARDARHALREGTLDLADRAFWACRRRVEAEARALVADGLLGISGALDALEGAIAEDRFRRFLPVEVTLASTQLFFPDPKVRRVIDDLVARM